MFSPQNPTCASFHYLQYFSDTFIRLKLNQDMYMIFLNCKNIYFPTMYLTCLIKKSFQMRYYFSLQYPSTIFRNKNEMIFQPMSRMSTTPECFLLIHDSIISQYATKKRWLRDIFFFTLIWNDSSPGLKTMGISQMGLKYE